MRSTGRRLSLRIGPACRPALGAAQGHPGGLPGRLPGREPGPPRGHEPAPRAAAPAAPAVPAADARDVGHRAGHRHRPERPGRGVALLRGLPGAALRRHPARLVRGPGAGPVRGRWRGAAVRCSAARAGARRHLARPIRRRAGQRLPDHPRRCTRSAAAASWARAWARACPRSGRRLPIPAIHTDFIFAGLAEELGMLGALAILGLYLVHRRARPAHRGAARPTTSARCSPRA